MSSATSLTQHHHRFSSPNLLTSLQVTTCIPREGAEGDAEKWHHRASTELGWSVAIMPIKKKAENLCGLSPAEWSVHN